MPEHNQSFPTTPLVVSYRRHKSGRQPLVAVFQRVKQQHTNFKRARKNNDNPELTVPTFPSGLRPPLPADNSDTYCQRYQTTTSTARSQMFPPSPRTARSAFASKGSRLPAVIAAEPELTSCLVRHLLNAAYSSNPTARVYNPPTADILELLH